jgi:glucosamine--fructose-6-phosphate aminotransferase (isomerizing)
MTVFLKELLEQPQALDATVLYYTTPAGQAALTTVVKAWRSGRYSQLIATGMGSSYFLAQAFALLLNKRGIRAFALNAGELLHYQQSLITADTLLLCISQSGESFETVTVLKELAASGIKPYVAAICNEAESYLAKHADALLPTLAGREEKTSSKTFITTYQVGYCLALALAGETADPAVWGKLSRTMQSLLDNRATLLPPMLKLMGDASFVQYISRGSANATASQCALMTMEASHTPASALSGGEFRHGPLEMVGPSLRAILFAHSGSSTFSQSLKLVNDITAFGGNVIFVTDRKPDLKPTDKLVVVEVPCDDEELFAIPSIAPIQVLIEAWAQTKGVTPGEFVHGNKVTAIE